MSSPPPRQRIYSGHRVRGSSALVAWIPRSIDRGQQAGLDRRARPPATVRRLSGSPGRARPIWSTPAGMGGVPCATAPTTSRVASAGGPEVRTSTRSYPSSTLATFRRGPWLPTMAAAASPRFRLLRVCRTLRSEAPPNCSPVLGEVPTPL
ncbi:hypothetical protein NDU88_006163 [Pleurodeles waltl]|uniref:Uncharacterized protein n=1 Tax=Pleurodeles waltl TaxID=8319 RepID=A0AAV7TWC8_PLEWA|nr:hypothetical protein NDU88_006163 [Pleurodeles waltl]